MKLWQCSECRDLLEDCMPQCQLITGDDVIPTECVRKAYIFKGKWYTDETCEVLIKDPQPESLVGIAKWSEIQKEDLLEIFG